MSERRIPRGVPSCTRCLLMKNSSRSNTNGRRQGIQELLKPAVPTVLPTMGSPKQYHCRTKITPHFEAPSKKARADPSSSICKPDWLKIGFNEIGKKDRDRGRAEGSGPTKKASPFVTPLIHPYPSTSPTLPQMTPPNTCVTDHKATVREHVGDTYFEFPGHAFFQNNISILVPTHQLCPGCHLPFHHYLHR
ncbi:hypothetical protein JVT61DRAFT_12603 [Boletus reticuloceps]|uniref:Uncharacterized protein n=1 Tax=Boletus reticuloceps TaxID=495285 RepID=A0A8I2YDR6_9AGAM|nr:hypothetical protein JVT61DRAFT_12603 [Boletus reticuloceps]